MIEKHFMLEGVKSADSAFSLTPVQFSQLVDQVRQAEQALGTMILLQLRSPAGSVLPVRYLLLRTLKLVM